MSSAVAPVQYPPNLSATLRQQTRDAHARAERVFVLAAKARRGSGPDLLMGLNHGLAAWLRDVSLALPPGPLTDEIHAFVEAVLDERGPAPSDLPSPPALDGEEAVVGAAYAVCGSALGAAVLADAWRDDLREPWLRFCTTSRALGLRWPSFSAALDAWGGTLRDPPGAFPEARETIVLDGARRAFDHAGAIVATLAPSIR